MNKRKPNRFNASNKSVTPNMSLDNNLDHAAAPQIKSIGVPFKDESPVRSGYCVLCKNSTVLVCQRCGDFYCSPNCQMKDWPKHRYICFQMPPLVNSMSKFSKDLPALNGYGNRELPPTMSVGGSPHVTQHRTWVNNNSAFSPPIHQQQQFQQHQQHQLQQDHLQQRQQQQQQQLQQQKQNPPSEIDRKNERVNIGKIEQASFPKNNSAVLLTAFRSSNRIFIRSIEKEENQEYCEIIKKINEYGKTAGPLKSMPTRNAFAITDFNNDDLFYRVQIVSVKSENEINVIYYDFGNEATKKLSELKEISRECAQLKQHIMLASLKNVPHVMNNDKLMEYLKSFEETEATIVYDEKEKPACELIPWGVEESINKKIKLFLQLLKEKAEMENKKIPAGKEEIRKQEPPAKAEKSPVQSHAPLPQKATCSETAATPPNANKKRPAQLAKPVMNPPFEIVHLPVGQKNVDIMVVDNSLLLFGYFGCVLCADKDNLQQIQKHLSEYEDNGQPYKPKVEEYCLAKFEGCWYRAKALTILSQDFVEVVFIDFLNESQVNTKSIRRYPMDLDYPCKTSLCMIEDLPSDLSDDIVDVLKENLQPGTEHTINEVKGVEEDAPDVFVIKMNQVAKWLNDVAT